MKYLKRAALGVAALSFVAIMYWWVLTRQTSPRQLHSNSSERIMGESSQEHTPLVRPSPGFGVGIVEKTPSQENFLRSADRQRLSILSEIFESKNDNDPRIDRELKVLDAMAKKAFRLKYGELQSEKRNERGTIVFLIGRNLTNQADFDFLCEVLREPPCYSLANCQGDASSVSKEDFHRESGEEVTLAYPQMVALNVLERTLEEDGVNVDRQRMAWGALQCAKDSRSGIVQKKAEELIRDFSGKF